MSRTLYAPCAACGVGEVADLATRSFCGRSHDRAIHTGAAVTDTILHVLQTMQDQLNRMEAKLESLVPRPEYEAFKVHVEAALRDVHTHRDSSHARIEHAIAQNGKAIEAVDAKVDAAERDRNSWARDVNLRVWLALLAAGLSIVVGLVARALT